jgi:hypothetical protein
LRFSQWDIPTPNCPSQVAYRFSVAKDLLGGLLELNLSVARCLAEAAPETLFSDDCIRFPALVKPYLCRRGECQGTTETR